MGCKNPTWVSTTVAADSGDNFHNLGNLRKKHWDLGKVAHIHKFHIPVRTRNTQHHHHHSIGSDLLGAKKAHRIDHICVSYQNIITRPMIKIKIYQPVCLKEYAPKKA